MSFLNSLNLRSKLIAALLSAAALTGITQAWLGNENVKTGFEEKLDTRLKATAEMTNHQLELYFKTVRGTVKAFGNDVMIAEAIASFSNRTSAILPSVMTPELDAQLLNFYSKDFAPKLAKFSQGEPLPAAFMPERAQSRYLQYQYMLKNSAQPKSAMDDAGDGSIYSESHKRYHPSLRGLAEGFSFADLLLISADGDVVYSVAKEPDYMSNLLFGPFSDSGLARVFRAARENRSTRPVVIEDYSFYEPSLGAPSAFAATPVFLGNEYKGVVVVQLSSTFLNGLVNKDKRWKEIDLGDSGDVFVVGNDGTMRSSTRLFAEDKKSFLEQSLRNGTTRNTNEKMEVFDSPIKLFQSELGEQALSGEFKDSFKRKTALGVDVRSFALPLKIDGMDWVTVVEMPITESVKPLRDFQRVMFIALAITTALTTIGAMLLSGALSRATRELTRRLQHAAGGDLVAPIALPGTDEVGEASRAAQSLADNLRTRIEDVERDRETSKNLLGRFLPTGIVRLITSRKSESGEDPLDNVIETIPNATYIMASPVGIDEIFSNQPPELATKKLDQLVEVIDVAAEKYGVEKVRFVSGTYFAIVGLSAPQIDHRQRGLSFANELLEIIERFNRDNNLSLSIKTGISSGSAVSALIGRHQLAFDVWGKPVDLCEALNTAAKPGEIRVAPEFAEAMKADANFQPPADRGLGLVLASTNATASYTASTASTSRIIR
jgi:class 3 adenylate cyclase/HAMP domain-containing protein